MRQLFELVGNGDLRFSPYCWRARMALAHKGLDAEFVPCRFTEIADRVAFADHDRVPVLSDGGRAVSDSWGIALYLEEVYPDAPTLFGGPEGIAFARFVNHWVDGTVNPPLAAALIPEVYEIVDPADRDYFKQSRDQRFGRPIESMAVEREANVATVRKILQPARALLSEQSFLAGTSPRYPDYVLFGTLQWARCTGTSPVLEDTDPINAWFETMLDLYDSAGRSAPARTA